MSSLFSRNKYMCSNTEAKQLEKCLLNIRPPVESVGKTPKNCTHRMTYMGDNRVYLQF